MWRMSGAVVEKKCKTELDKTLRLAHNLTENASSPAEIVLNKLNAVLCAAVDSNFGDAFTTALEVLYRSIGRLEPEIPSKDRLILHIARNCAAVLAEAVRQRNEATATVRPSRAYNDNTAVQWTQKATTVSPPPPYTKAEKSWSGETPNEDQLLVERKSADDSEIKGVFRQFAAASAAAAGVAPPFARPIAVPAALDKKEEKLESEKSKSSATPSSLANPIAVPSLLDKQKPVPTKVANFGIWRPSAAPLSPATVFAPSSPGFAMPIAAAAAAEDKKEEISVRSWAVPTTATSNPMMLARPIAVAAATEDKKEEKSSRWWTAPTTAAATPMLARPIAVPAASEEKKEEKSSRWWTAPTTAAANPMMLDRPIAVPAAATSVQHVVSVTVTPAAASAVAAAAPTTQAADKREVGTAEWRDKLRRQFPHKILDFSYEAVEGRICIYHLPKDVRDADVRQLLQPFGPIVRMLWGAAKAGNSPYALVKLESNRAANAAVAHLNNTRFGGVKILVQRLEYLSQFKDMEPFDWPLLLPTVQPQQQQQRMQQQQRPFLPISKAEAAKEESKQFVQQQQPLLQQAEVIDQGSKNNGGDVVVVQQETQLNNEMEQQQLDANDDAGAEAQQLPPVHTEEQPSMPDCATAEQINDQVVEPEVEAPPAAALNSDDERCKVEAIPEAPIDLDEANDELRDDLSECSLRTEISFGVD